MTEDQQKLYKAIITSMAAGLIEQLVQILDEQGIEIEPMNVAIQGVPTATITTAQISEQLRQISGEFRPITVKTISQDNTE